MPKSGINEREVEKLRTMDKKQGAAAPPCAACKLLRRRCAADCIFAPYFPSDELHNFAIVHKIFGASNVSKLLQELSAANRSDAVSSLVYEAKARVRDPVYGCVASIATLQRQIDFLRAQLAVAQAELVRLHHAAAWIAAAAPLCTDADAAVLVADSGNNISQRSVFSMDTFLDHSNAGLPMWSAC